MDPTPTAARDPRGGSVRVADHIKCMTASAPRRATGMLAM